MRALFDTWKDEIRHYCEEHGLSFDKAQHMCRAWNQDILYLQYHDPDKGKEGLRDETRMPVALVMRIENGKPVFEQTEYTHIYLM